jgi:hypothetical protein
MGELGGVLVFLGVGVCCLGIFPIGALMIIVGAIFWGFGAIAQQQRTPTTPMEKGPFCPACHGHLNGRPRVCQHCRSELRWIGDEKALTLDEFSEYEREKEQAERERGVEEWRRSEIARERREMVAAAGMASGRASVEFVRSLGSLTVAAAVGFNSLLKKGAGDGNEIIYRFLQFLVYLGLPAAIAFVAWNR